MGQQATIPYHQLHGIVAGGQEVAASNTGGAAGFNTSLPATPGVTNLLTHMTVSAQQVASVVAGTVVVSGVVGGPLTFEFVETVTAGGYIDHIFIPPLPATGQNVAITATLSAIAGGSSAAIVLEGWQA